jgi:hypothetical protein
MSTNRTPKVVIADYDFGDVDIERSIVTGAGFELKAARQSAVAAVERHLEQRTCLAVDAEYGFEQEPDEDPADGELAHRHHADHDDVRARDAPDLPDGRQVLAQEERGGHQGDQMSGQLPPDGEYILWKKTRSAD